MTSKTIPTSEQTKTWISTLSIPTGKSGILNLPAEPEPDANDPYGAPFPREFLTRDGAAGRISNQGEDQIEKFYFDGPQELRPPARDRNAESQHRRDDAPRPITRVSSTSERWTIRAPAFRRK